MEGEKGATLYGDPDRHTELYIETMLQMEREKKRESNEEREHA